MAGEIVAAVTSVGGVIVGGGLSFLVQHHTQRLAARTEQRKLDTARADARRTERLAALERFIAAAADAEHVAFARPDTWEVGGAWENATNQTMNRMGVAESMIQVLFGGPAHEQARTYGRIINRAVWDGVPSMTDLYDRLDEARDRFLAAARDALLTP